MAIELLSSNSDSDFMDSVKHHNPKQALTLSCGLLSDKDKAIEVFDLSSNSEKNIGFTKLGAPKKRKYLKPADFELSSEMEPETEDEFCAKKKKGKNQLSSSDGDPVCEKREGRQEKEPSSEQDSDKGGCSDFVPAVGLKFPSFDSAYQKCCKYGADRGIRWRKSTKTSGRGPQKQYFVRRLLCQSYGSKQIRKTKGARLAGPSVRCGCSCNIQLYEHMENGTTIMNKVDLNHTFPCEPGIRQLLRGRRKAGANPSSIPFEILQELSTMFHTQVPTQSIRELLIRKPNFPRSILIDTDFIRSMRLYIKSHGISPDMPVTVIRDKLGLPEDTSGIEYEDFIISAGLSTSSTALAAREAGINCIDDLLSFLSFVEAKDPMLAVKVVYLQDTDKIAAVFTMSGYQRAKLSNFGDLLFFDCKRSGISVLEWPKPIVSIIDQEGKLHDTCTGMMYTENHEM